MTVKELLDVLDVDRGYNSQILEVATDSWNEFDSLPTCSPFLDFIGECEIKCMGSDNIRIQIDWPKHEGKDGS